MLKDQGRYRNQIIGMSLSEDETYLAIVSGKNKIMDEQHLNQLFVYQINWPGSATQFKLIKRHKLSEDP